MEFIGKTFFLKKGFPEPFPKSFSGCYSDNVGSGFGVNDLLFYYIGRRFFNYALF